MLHTIVNMLRGTIVLILKPFDGNEVEKQLAFPNVTYAMTK